MVERSTSIIVVGMSLLFGIRIYQERESNSINNRMAYRFTIYRCTPALVYIYAFMQTLMDAVLLLFCCSRRRFELQMCWCKKRRSLTKHAFPHVAQFRKLSYYITRLLLLLLHVDILLCFNAYIHVLHIHTMYKFTSINNWLMREENCKHKNFVI